MTTFRWGALFIVAALAGSLPSRSRAVDDDVKTDAPKAADERMAFLDARMRRYQICDAADREKPHPLQETLGLRWTNPVSGVVDGGIFIWTDGERPVVVAKCFLNERKEAWGECIQSVAERPLVMSVNGEDVWQPSPGVTFHRVEDEQPSKTASAAARLSRMRQMMRRMKITSLWGQETPTPWQLRPLTAPVYRYSSDHRGIVDGAVFAFTQGGTNPEAIGIVEIRERDGVRTCHVAVTRLSSYALTAAFDDKTIADLPRLTEREPKDSFYYGWHWFTRYPFPKSGEQPPIPTDATEPPPP